MVGLSEKEGLSLGQPAAYEIVVQGVIAQEHQARLGGLRFDVGPGGHGGSATTLSGRIQDQAQLIGVLNALYEMRLPILSVEVRRLD